MKELIIDNVDDHLMVMSDDELKLIESLTYYFNSVTREETGMTKNAYNLNEKLLNKLQKMNLNGCSVWE